MSTGRSSSYSGMRDSYDSYETYVSEASESGIPLYSIPTLSPVLQSESSPISDARYMGIQDSGHTSESYEDLGKSASDEYARHSVSRDEFNLGVRYGKGPIIRHTPRKAVGRLPVHQLAPRNEEYYTHEAGDSSNPVATRAQSINLPPRPLSRYGTQRHQDVIGWNGPYASYEGEAIYERNPIKCDEEMSRLKWEMECLKRESKENKKKNAEIEKKLEEMQKCWDRFHGKPDE